MSFDLKSERRASAGESRSAGAGQRTSTLASPPLAQRAVAAGTGGEWAPGSSATRVLAETKANETEIASRAKHSRATPETTEVPLSV